MGLNCKMGWAGLGWTLAFRNLPTGLSFFIFACLRSARGRSARRENEGAPRAPAAAAATPPLPRRQALVRSGGPPSRPHPPSPPGEPAPPAAPPTRPLLPRPAGLLSPPPAPLPPRASPVPSILNRSPFTPWGSTDLIRFVSLVSRLLNLFGCWLADAREEVRVDHEPAYGVRARRRLHRRVPQLGGFAGETDARSL
jgi:hypothetical protein